MIGRSFGDFVIKDLVGKGGAGEVYRAEQVTLGREAVLKVMRGTGNEDPDAANRFLREARLASRLDHPFVAHVYGFGSEEDGTLWIAMELVRGMALDQVIKDQGAVPLSRFIPFMERVCEVLFAAHEQGIVHRDIKPHNIMVLSRAGQMLPKLLDLGIARRGTEDHDDAAKAPSSGETRLTQTIQARLADSEALEITRQGVLIGTPHYMPPEQWRDASRATSRSDIYSLAILAFQALTGKLPYEGAKTVFTLALAHAREPLPALPETLPSALHDVLSKAAAKKPEDRYATALEFSAALRVASGIAGEPLALPQLDRAVLDSVVIDAPQPIAEATALIDAARSPKQQLEAVAVARRVVLRYLATVAIASRGRVGPGASEDIASVRELFAALASDKLSDPQWHELSRELARPFALRPAAHPVPELVRFFFAEADGGASTPAHGPGEEALATLAACDWPTAGASDEHLRAALPKLVAAFAMLLQKLSFLCDYSLAVRHEETERWMGTRRIRRSVQAVHDTPPPAGEPFLVDRLNLAVLSLAPLMQVFTPSGGMPEEIFFLDGAGRHGARLVALPATFERQSEEVWPWFTQHILDVTHAQHEAAEAEKPPYKGLSTFTADDADNYYGREREAESFANRLRSQSLLAVVGPSGVGKSSFVLAGVLPLLPAGWRALVVRPGATPFAALAARAQAEGLGVIAPAQLAQSLVAALPTDVSLLIVVDQFEELVTLCQDSAERTAFARALVDAAEDKRGRLKVVLTLRDDFLIKIQQLTPLRERLSSSLQLLATPANDDLLRVVTEPARRVGYTFDDKDLPRIMVEAVAEYPGALALLSFTASQLWELRDRQLRQMRAKTYDALGGVGGALAHHAEVTLANLSADEAKLVREAFRHLVTAQGTRAVLSRSEMLDVLGGSKAAQSVIEKLILARLLVSSESDGGEDRIEIIHEALVVAWPRLVTWQREDGETARLRDSLRASARQWDERGRPRGLLWRAETLDEYKVWRRRYPGRLTQSEEAFATASVRDDTRGRRIRQALAVTAFAAMVVALVLIARAYQEAKQRFLALREEEGRLALVDGRPLEALAYLADAVRSGADSANLRIMANDIAFELQGDRGILTQHTQPVYRFRLDKSGTHVLSLGENAWVGWSSIRDASVRTKIETAASCSKGELTPDQTHAVLGCADGRVRVVDLSAGTITATWKIGGYLNDVTVARDGKSALISENYAGVHRIDLASGTLAAVFLDKAIPTTASIESADGALQAIYDSNLDDLAGALTGLVLIHHGVQTRVPLTVAIRSAVFNRSGTLLAVAVADGSIGLFDVVRKEWRWHHAAHNKRLFSIVFSPDEKRLVSAGNDGVMMWSLSGERQWVVSGRASLSTTCFSPDGERLFAGGDELGVHAFDAQSADILWRYRGHRRAITQCEVTPDGSRLITSGMDGEVRAWDPHQRSDTLIAGLNDARDIDGVLGKGVLSVATTRGLYALAPDLSSRPVRAEPVATDAVTFTAVSSNGRAAWVINDVMRIIDTSSGTELARVKLASNGSSVSISPQGTRAVSRLGNDDSLVFAPVGPTPIPSGGDYPIPIGFLDESLFVACSSSGKLRIWDVTSGKAVAEVAAHGGECFGDLLGDGIIRTSDAHEGGLVRWQWDGVQLRKLEAIETPPDLVWVSRQAPLNVLVRGGWQTMASDGLPLANIPLSTRNGFRLFTANNDGFFFATQYGALARLAPPPVIGLKGLLELDECRGIFGLSTGHLNVRTAGHCARDGTLTD